MKPDVREALISIRAKKSQRDLIDMAESLVSKSLTDFMIACQFESSLTKQSGKGESSV